MRRPQMWPSVFRLNHRIGIPIESSGMNHLA